MSLYDITTQRDRLLFKILRQEIRKVPKENLELALSLCKSVNMILDEKQKAQQAKDKLDQILLWE